MAEFVCVAEVEVEALGEIVGSAEAVAESVVATEGVRDGEAEGLGSREALGEVVGSVVPVADTA